MRSTVLAVCILASACSSQGLGSPTSPTRVLSGTQTSAQSGTQLPFRGSLTAADQGVVAFPNLHIEGTAEGTATELGRFTATYFADAVLGIPTATGGYDFTAANGDHLVTTFTGEALDSAPGIESFTEHHTIQSGTGRFAAAGGTFTIRRSGPIDYATGKASSSGSLEGNISLNK